MDNNANKVDGFRRILMSYPHGYSEGVYRGRRYGLTVTHLSAQNIKLYAEELGGSDHISFNFYILASDEPLLKTCEMSEAKVTAFVEGFVPEKS